MDEVGKVLHSPENMYGKEEDYPKKRSIFEKARNWLCLGLGCCNELSDYLAANELVLKLTEDELTDCFDDLQTCNIETIALENKIKELTETPFNPTKIPEKNIRYLRNIQLGDTVVTKSISVRNFITANDDNYKDLLKNADLILSDDEQIDCFVPEIYKLAKKKYKYVFDSSYGFAENWMFPFELDAALEIGKGGDCEDYAHKIVTFLRIAGVPADRVFVSCGTTRDRFGHSTVYVRDSEMTWRHLNSTTPMFKHDDLKKFPDNKNENDYVGIREGGFWFSFNDAISISKFETAEAESLFNAEPTMKKVLIE